MKLTDRNGFPLRELLAPEPIRKEPKKLAEFSPLLTAAVIAAEDKRFYLHAGVDPIAMARAAWVDLRSGRVVSGGSTITMQLARLSMGLSPGPRTFGRKTLETVRALKIERHRGKEEILESYMNLAPTGDLTLGFEAASKFYLGKSAAFLSPAEAAFLAGLPAAPGAFNPRRNPDKAIARRNLVLGRMLKTGAINAELHERAIGEPLGLVPEPPPQFAPHFTTMTKKLLADLSGPGGNGGGIGTGTGAVSGAVSGPRTLRTTLDLSLQLELEKMAGETVEKFGHKGMEQVSVVVMTVPEREILAWIGSGDFHDPEDGQIDGVLAPRQPGSALKPFVYAMGFEEGIVDPSGMMSDAAIDYVGANSVFSPRNYRDTHGAPISARVALASSLNIPAVNLTNAVGPRKVLAKLRELGLDTLDRDHEHYGLGISLGAGEVNLLDLTAAYASLADGGMLQSPRLFLPPEADGRPDNPPAPALNPKPTRTRVFSEEVAFLIGDILADDDARSAGFGSNGILATDYPASVKTGTSSNFKDNWCLGYTDRFVVGVWAGNFPNKPMLKVSGVSGAGELWRRVTDYLVKNRPPSPRVIPPGLAKVRVCPVSGLPAGPDCPNSREDFFLKSRPLPPECDHAHLTDGVFAIPALGQPGGFRLINPQNGELYASDPGLPPSSNRIKALAQSVPEVEELVWILNGEEMGREKVDGRARTSKLIPLEKGENSLELVGIVPEGRPRRAVARYTVK
ncbi:MAG: penicillin-binding protein 1C [Deltaproteobacteria bacterium]|nr:penicillin-binding protein 1C [Deltaproteobacteria bacterium]